MLPREKQFSKLERLWFHHGGSVLGFSGGPGLNDKMVKNGWRLVDAEMLEYIFHNHQRFLHRQDGYLIATNPDCIEKDGDDLIVPCIVSSDKDGLVLTRLRLDTGMIWDHSEIKVLVVK